MILASMNMNNVICKLFLRSAIGIATLSVATTTGAAETAHPSDFGLARAAPVHKFDPLNAVEIDAIVEIVRARSSASPAGRSRGLAEANRAETERTELLLVERHQGEKDDPARRADVYVYDYNTNELVHTIVDVETQETISVERSRGTQLPLTQNEIQRARDLIFGDDEEFALIDAEYQRITGGPLSDVDQLNVKAFTFHAASLRRNLNPASKRCGKHRCAQVLLYTAHDVVFEISPIVDLSANVVTQNIGF